MAVLLSPVGGVAAQFFNNDGVPLSGGLIYTYAAGSSTPVVTYTTSAGSIPHSNPIVLDSAGRVPTGEIWLTDGVAYKFVLKDSTGALLATYDNIVGINSNFVNYSASQEIQTATAGQTVFTLTTMAYQPGTNSLSVFVDGVNQYGPGAQYAYVETSSTVVTFASGLHVGASVKFTTTAINSASYGDAFQISYTPPFTNSATTNVGDKLAQIISVNDFIPAGTNTSTTDCSVYIQNAIDAAPTSLRSTLMFDGGKQYYIGDGNPSIIVDKPLIIEGNGASLLYSTTASSGVAMQLQKPYIVVNNLNITKSSFPLTDPSDLTCSALYIYSDVTAPTQKFTLNNVSIEGFLYGMVFNGDGAGVSYGDVYSPRIRFCAYGMVFDSANSDPSYCTNINVFGGELSLAGFSTYSIGVGIDIRNTNSFHANNGINFYGTNVEGSWVRKLRCEGQDCAFNNLYWDATNSGTDIEFVNNVSSGQLSQYNLIVGGSPLWQQTIVNTSGLVNTVIDNKRGLGFGNPVLPSNIAFQFDNVSVGGGGVKGVIGNIYPNALNNGAGLEFQARNAAGTLVAFGGISASISNITGGGTGVTNVGARNAGGYLRTFQINGDDGFVTPDIDAVNNLGTSTKRWLRVESKEGFVVTTPDGTKRYLIAVNNAGSLTATLL